VVLKSMGVDCTAKRRRILPESKNKKQKEEEK